MDDLPAGTVTFMFTDVEDSTGLLQRLGENYVGVLGEHRRLIRAAVQEAGGQELDCRADELFVVFVRSQDAVSAAVAAQAALGAHAWPGGVDLRVRMGIHTGTPALTDEGYVGIDVHRAARVSAAGHGGQILLSGRSFAELGGELPADVTVRDLGDHDLKGLAEPERIYELVSASAPGRSLPLRTPATAPAEHRRVVLADDSVLFREGVALLLEDAGFEVAGQSATADDLLLKVRSYRPDVAIVDIKMPPSHTDEGLRAAREIREHNPDTGVLVLSQYAEPAYAMELLADSAEGVGYLLKDRVSNINEFTAAVRRVADGGSALDPEVVSQLVRQRQAPIDDLSAREREVLGLMAEGRSNRAIAEQLFVTERAVEKHVTSIFGKLRVPASSEDHRRVLAVLAFLQG